MLTCDGAVEDERVAIDLKVVGLTVGQDNVGIVGSRDSLIVDIDTAVEVRERTGENFTLTGDGWINQTSLLTLNQPTWPTTASKSRHSCLNQ